jgi:hypothetical protein
MPAKSKAQWRMWAARLERGEISKAEFREMIGNADYSELPETVKGKKSKRKKK